MGPILKKMAIVLVAAAVVSAGAWLVVLWAAEARDEAARRDIRIICQALGEHHGRTGAYPDTIDDILKALPGGDEKILLVLPRSRIRYQAEGDGYRLLYYHWPLGPFHGYDSRTDRWFWEE